MQYNFFVTVGSIIFGPFIIGDEKGNSKLIPLKTRNGLHLLGKITTPFWPFHQNNQGEMHVTVYTFLLCLHNNTAR